MLPRCVASRRRVSFYDFNFGNANEEPAWFWLRVYLHEATRVRQNVKVRQLSETDLEWSRQEMIELSKLLLPLSPISISVFSSFGLWKPCSFLNTSIRIHTQTAVLNYVILILKYREDVFSGKSFKTWQKTVQFCSTNLHPTSCHCAARRNVSTPSCFTIIMLVRIRAKIPILSTAFVTLLAFLFVNINICS